MKNHWLELDRLKMWSNGIEYVIAESEKDAVEICFGLHGANYDELMNWGCLTDDYQFEMDTDGTRITKSVREWIDEHGRGYFASSEY